MLKLNDIAFVKVFTVHVSKYASWLKQNIKPFNIFLGFILTTISIGIWAQVLQNAGIIKTVQKVKVVYPVDVRGTVDIENIENTVSVKGNVDVDNTVDIEGEVEIIKPSSFSSLSEDKAMLIKLLKEDKKKNKMK